MPFAGPAFGAGVCAGVCAGVWRGHALVGGHRDHSAHQQLQRDHGHAARARVSRARGASRVPARSPRDLAQPLTQHLAQPAQDPRRALGQGERLLLLTGLLWGDCGDAERWDGAVGSESGGTVRRGRGSPSRAPVRER
eukprot:3168172-Rhodomonas_salina.3